MVGWLNLKISLKRMSIILLLFLVAFFGLAPSLARAQSTITINPNTKYQTIVGWEATDYAGDLNSAVFPNYKDALYDQVVNDVGINRLRLGVRSGVENSTDYETQYVNGQITYQTWRCVRYSTVNDNSDPNNINWGGFQFTQFDKKIDNLVLPLKQRLEAKGEKLYINLEYVAFTEQMKQSWCPPNLTYVHNQPAEYAEFMLAVTQHLKNKYNIIPDAWEIILEPANVVEWNSGTIVGNGLVALAAKLQANGFTPSFIAPSNPGMDASIKYFDQMIGVSGVLNYPLEFAYHRYWSGSVGSLQQIASRGMQYGLNTSMLEWWDQGNTYATLHEDLKVGRNSAWQPTTVLDLYTLNATDPNNPILTMRWQTKWQRHILKYVRAGAVRIDITSNNSNLDPLVFQNKDGTYVVVVWNKTWGGRSFTISGLPAGTYGIKYIQGDTYNNNIQADTTKQDVTLSPGQSLTENLPEQGVMTIFGKISALTGDVNNDGKEDVLDIQACVNHILLIQDWGSRADVNKDGTVNVLDVQVTVNKILGV